MKKLMAIVLMFVALGAFADSWLSVDFAFQMGWIPQGEVQMYQPDNRIFLANFNAVFSIVAILYKFLFVGGKLINPFSIAQKIGN
jgi:hypothetical protein